MTAKKSSFWGNRYDISLGGVVVASWDGGFWKGGGSFVCEGQRYEVRRSAWGSRFSMVDANNAPVASAERVGRKRWTVEAAGQTYDFQRASAWTSEQVLQVAGVRAGSVKRVSHWSGETSADLPGLPLPVQIFVVGVVITMWNDQSAAAAAS